MKRRYQENDINSQQKRAKFPAEEEQLWVPGIDKNIDDEVLQRYREEKKSSMELPGTGLMYQGEEFVDVDHIDESRWRKCRKELKIVPKDPNMKSYWDTECNVTIDFVDEFEQKYILGTDKKSFPT